MMNREKAAELVDLTSEERTPRHRPVRGLNINQNDVDIITIDDSGAPAPPDIIDVLDDSESDDEQQPSPRNFRAPKHITNAIRDRPPQPYSQVLTRPRPPPRPRTPENTLKCPICIDTYKDIKRKGIKIVVTRCGHLFCEYCVKKAISENGRKCPKCRKTIVKGPTGLIEVFDVS